MRAHSDVGPFYEGEMLNLSCSVTGGECCYCCCCVVLALFRCVCVLVLRPLVFPCAMCACVLCCIVLLCSLCCVDVYVGSLLPLCCVMLRYYHFWYVYVLQCVAGEA